MFNTCFELAAYLDNIERVSGTNTWSIPSQGFRGKINTNLVKCLREIPTSRAGLFRKGIRNIRNAELALSGFLIHYNLFSPHESLDKKTPAHVAGIKLPYGNWAAAVDAQASFYKEYVHPLK